MKRIFMIIFLLLFFAPPLNLLSFSWTFHGVDRLHASYVYKDNPTEAYYSSDTLPQGYYDCIQFNSVIGVTVMLSSNTTVYLMVLSQPPSYGNFGGVILHQEGKFFLERVNVAGELYLVVYNNVSSGTALISNVHLVGQKAPTGIAEVGVQPQGNGLVPFVQNFTEAFGYVKVYSISAFNTTPPNGTSQYGASLQLNTVVQVNTPSGSQQYWAQDVIEFNTKGQSYCVYDNVWNFTSTQSELNGYLVRGEGSVYPYGLQENYAFGTPSHNYSLPFSLGLTDYVTYNLTSFTIHFGFINSSGTFWYDNVTLLIPNEGAYMLVSGYNSTGGGQAYDAELVFGGEDNGEFTQYLSLNATLDMFFLDGNHFFSPRYVTPFGLDTEESADDLNTIPLNGAWEVTTGEMTQSLLSQTSSLESRFSAGVADADFGIPVNWEESGGEGPYVANLTLTSSEGTQSYLFLEPFPGNYSGVEQVNLNSGNYSYTLTVTDGLGQSSSFNGHLTVNPDPEVDVRGENVTDAHLTISEEACATLGTPPYNYTWLVNGEVVGHGKSITLNYSEGNYNVTVLVQDSLGFTTSFSKTVTVNPDPTLNLIYQEDEVGIPVTERVNVSGGTPPFEVSWSLQGSASSGDAVVVNGTRVGTIEITVKLTDSAGFTGIYNFTVNVKPHLELSVTHQETNNFLFTNHRVSLQYSTTGGVGNVTYCVYLNGEEVYHGSSPPYTLTLTQGDNNITVIAKDSLGARSAAEFTIYSSLDYVPLLIVGMVVMIIVIAVLRRR
ncbi:Thermopsin [Sulfuracidifex tepidarius]|uniref:Thermopsin n=1 Tax=Sulfuracidifex tepidarius TaxID=1294262 RepID=A0A510DSM2_9CREN|nr:thermopsin family protease [Sulfuracidifex tepidarius]BBG23173.1 Thermopsin [Sulfuracidifex tepidarius]